MRRDARSDVHTCGVTPPGPHEAARHRCGPPARPDRGATRPGSRVVLRNENRTERGQAIGPREGKVGQVIRGVAPPPGGRPPSVGVRTTTGGLAGERREKREGSGRRFVRCAAGFGGSCSVFLAWVGLGRCFLVLASRWAFDSSLISDIMKMAGAAVKGSWTNSTFFYWPEPAFRFHRSETRPRASRSSEGSRSDQRAGSS